MKLLPYVFFHGRCEEALEFYKAALGGSYEAMRVKDTPMGGEFPADWNDKIMHAHYTFDGGEMLAADGRPATMSDNNEVGLTLMMDDEAKADRIFTALSAGGTVTMPMEKQFWGSKFGSFTDKFGIDWQINCEL